MTNITTLPNPSTPLAFLDPALADQFEASRYLFAATLGAYVWDITLNLGNDYALLFNHRVRFPTVVYFLSRVSTLAYILTCFIFAVTSIENCAAMEISIGICLLLSQTYTAMLFFLRANAVWYPNRVASAVFFLLWLGIIGTNVTVPLGLRGAHIGPTMQCISTDVPDNIRKTRSYLTVVVIMSLVNDTVVFLAISYRIVGYAVLADSPRDLIRAFFGGSHLTRLSRELIQSGQQFYLVAVCANILLIILVKLPISPTFRGMASVPACSLINAMASLVFRKVKFGLISADGTVGETSIKFHVATNPRSLSLQYPPGTTENPVLPLDVQIASEREEFGHSVVSGRHDTFKAPVLA
ncbi:hypothetical protein DFH08DRAFT_760870 [Mycena albidolilacea]|uniref:Uncharacterized protein n=1 Tax=Mycena albidolilacea TaxID=1033008 RepID=A0AAD7ATK1_9AGAR|nr:hypothetical protein DFH08DRAFT_760870 [Mycena albidolilacea]